MVRRSTVRFSLVAAIAINAALPSFSYADLSTFAPGEAGQPGNPDGTGGRGGLGGVSRAGTIRDGDEDVQYSVRSQGRNRIVINGQTIVEPEAGEAGQPGQPGQGGAGGRGGGIIIRQAARPSLPAESYDVVPGQPGQPGRGGAGGAGGKGGVSVIQSERHTESVTNTNKGVPHTVVRETVVDASGRYTTVTIDGKVVQGQPGQPGRADGTGGAGGKGGVSVVAPAAVKPSPVVASAAKPVAPLSRAKRLEFDCSKGSSYTFFVDLKMSLKSADGKRDFYRLASFCPQNSAIKMKDPVTAKEVSDCRAHKLSSDELSCRLEFTQLNDARFDDQGRRYVAGERVTQAFAGISFRNIAAIEKTCGLQFGRGEAFTKTTCERTSKIAISTTPDELSCFVKYVNKTGEKEVTPKQRACYNLVRSLRAPFSSPDYTASINVQPRQTHVIN